EPVSITQTGDYPDVVRGGCCNQEPVQVDRPRRICGVHCFGGVSTVPFRRDRPPESGGVHSMGLPPVPPRDGMVIPAHPSHSVPVRRVGGRGARIAGLGVLCSDPSCTDALRRGLVRRSGVVVWPGYAPGLAFHPTCCPPLLFRDSRFLMVLAPHPA